jgi:hypothetical protein
MSRRLFLVFAIIGAIGLHPADASTGDSSRQGISDFQKNNPDVRKYEFARSYITALGYLKAIDDRWNKKVKVIRASVNDLAEDNADLRIFKNYLVKYQDSPNGLIRKITNTVVTATGREIAVNDDEKTLWEEWYDLNKAGHATRPKEVDFVKAQHALALRRKEADKDIVQTSVLLTKVLMSDKNADSHGRRLAITSQQRQKLLDKLDSFGRDTLDWGLKPGQRTLEASIAAIREVLEDSIWISIDEK